MKPKNNRRSTKRKLAAPKNNIKPTGGTVDTKKLKSKVKRMANKVKVNNNRDYIAKTTKAGADEFNNTKIRPSKGGKSATTGQVAKFNKGRLIKGSAKPTLKGGLAGVALTALEAAGRHGKLGKKVQDSIHTSDRAADDAYKAGKEQLGKIKKAAMNLFNKGKAISPERGRTFDTGEGRSKKK